MVDRGFCWSLSISGLGCAIFEPPCSPKKGGNGITCFFNVSPLNINPYRLERALLAGLSRNIRHTDDRSQSFLSSDVPCSVERVLDTPLPDVACLVDRGVKYSTIHRSTNIAIDHWSLGSLRATGEQSDVLDTAADYPRSQVNLSSIEQRLESYTRRDAGFVYAAGQAWYALENYVFRSQPVRYQTGPTSLDDALRSMPNSNPGFGLSGLRQDPANHWSLATWCCCA